MPNQPNPETITVSFTLPRGLSDLISGMAKKSLTNRSDIIRRALLNYIPPEEAALIQDSMVNDATAPPAPTKYPKGGACKKSS
jgi:hypothetical protein